ncbi:hypothetical protein Tc00.1047053511223.10 [Trypanosoma cruzi]|uniref:Uncharacterized protein n=1 Tax=Trypanosoma cruzi (strain CL Brener) TaxID=353153 RepID=Q4CLU1_TRYCC|nr:hypothetical protein Tc00.1047053511223.10 [Trypanosoma cruzi]EAN81243.1 hypothetical protein Tc00.1047053511223.10 [Trypanosoma cruzi]|eukprot:XP_802689.1 hypothetical protein [Trypanosoma cruzi strain CL Brener]
MSLGSLFSVYFCHALLLYIFVCASLHMLCSCFYFFASCVCRHTQPHARTRCALQWIWMLLLWRVLAVAGGCCFLCGHGARGGGERERAPRVTLPAGVMRAMGCDCCGGPHPFGVRFSAVVPCDCACHLLCACVLGMCFRSVGRPPPFFCGLCEWARADEGQGAWNEGMA